MCPSWSTWSVSPFRLGAWLLTLACGVGCGRPDARLPDPEPATAYARALGQALAPEAEPNDDLGNATVLTGNDVVIRANIYGSGDSDFYRFDALAGDRVFAATMTAFSASGSGDSTLDLLAPDGVTLLESDLDNGTFGASSASISGAPIPADGAYFLRVTHGTGGQLRPYDLYLKLQRGVPTFEVEPNEAPNKAQPVPASGWVFASAGALADIDTYAVTLAAGDTLFASLDLAPARADPLDVPEWNGQLAFYDPDGFSVSANDAGAAGPDSDALVMTVQKPGTYYLEVTASVGGTAVGDYQLSVAVHPARTPAAGVVCGVYASTNAFPIAIPIGPGVVSTTLTVPGHPRIASLEVLLRLNHTFMPDLDVHLTAPAGNTGGLFTDVGTRDEQILDLTFADDAALPVGTFPDMRNAVVAPEAGYRLAWFEGEDAGGTWTLTVRDDATADEGSILAFALRICSPAPASCPNPATPPATIFLRDFEGSDGNFTHAPIGAGVDEWEYGTPSGIPLAGCHGGVGCWKTDLDQRYDPNTNADLVSPPIDLGAASPPIRLDWALLAQLEQAGADHAWIEVREIGGGGARARVWEHLGPNMVDGVGSPTTTLHESMGWGLHTADLSAFQGKQVELVAHLDSDGNFGSSSNLGGLGLDDITVTACPHACGDGFVDFDESCDHGAANGQPGDCCTASCQFATVDTVCRPATGDCDVVDLCDGAGACVADAKVPNDTACSDGDACTQVDTCQAGACLGASPIVCTPSDPCHVAGVCNPGSGVCSNPPIANGTPCDDLSACTQGDACQAGACVPGTPTLCTATAPCHADGVCDPQTGLCSDPLAADGAPCNDQDGCSQVDSCIGGICIGTTPVVCAALDQCHVVGVCDSATGTCSNPPIANGTACDDQSLCTLGDTCQAGTCTGASTIACSASGPCHVVGVCDPATGACSDPAAIDGTPCDDGDGCTSPDACQAGACVAAGATICTAKDSCHAAGVCDVQTGACTNPALADDTPCDDQSACTRVDACQAGSCVGSDPIVCTPSDQCHAAGACDPASGACSNPAAPNGTACVDGSACTRSDTCQAGACVGASPTVCTPSDGCHVAGLCDPATGDCSDPEAPDGTACEDIDACTLGDTCAAGVCRAGSPVVCAALDACHDAGTCDSESGLCSNPAAPEGRSCDDGDPCTRSDLCRAGVCTGEDPTLCPARDQCHLEGSCDKATGLCSDPIKPNGIACDDGNGCTRIDTCKSGNCTGLSLVVCAPIDLCHEAGVCDPATGACSTPLAADGTACSDNNACTRADTCSEGQCQGGDPMVCTPSDSCHLAGVCNVITGLCTNPPAPDDSVCDDANACTHIDRCQAGRCAGADPVVCAARDACHSVGLCDPSTGVCSDPPLADGTICDDDNRCTRLDVCDKGVCFGAHPRVCTPIDACHSGGTCDPETGACSSPLAADGKACNDGDACTRSDTCEAGICRGANPIACAASDACHVAGACDPATGACTDPRAEDGTLCEDHNACTRIDLCRGGTCQGRQPVECPPLDICHVTGTCNPLDGLCSRPLAPVGTPCNDLDPCTEEDVCSGGTCAGRDVCSGDDDHDGLNNGEEQTLGTDPRVADTDGDGLPDGAEIEGSGVLTPWGPTDPLDADGDDDGLSDGVEATGNPSGAGVAAGRITDPSDPDSDGDTLSDGLEAGLAAGLEGGATPGGIAFAGSDPALFRADDDPDTTTNPAAADSDDDGLDDGVEDANRDGAVTGLVLGGTGSAGRGESDPRQGDTDHDGLVDGTEGIFGTSATDADSDDGSALDGAEVTAGTNPLDPKDDIPPPPKRPEIIGGGACGAGDGGLAAALLAALGLLVTIGRGGRRCGRRPRGAQKL